METLKPCPFCGREVEMSKVGGEYGLYWWCIHHKHYKAANRCLYLSAESEQFAGVFAYDGEQEKKELIEKWNRRAKDGKSE